MSNSILSIFDGGDVAEISALIDKLEKSSFDYLKLEGNGFRIVIGKNGAGESFESVATPLTAVKESSAQPLVEKPVAAQQISIPIPMPQDSEKPDVCEQEGVYIVRSPNYGLFYAQSEPGAPPYVKIGTTVKTGDTVGLLETMKTFTAISSPAQGEVIAIHVKNEETLEPGWPVVSIQI